MVARYSMLLAMMAAIFISSGNIGTADEPETKFLRAFAGIPATADNFTFQPKEAITVKTTGIAGIEHVVAAVDKLFQAGNLKVAGYAVRTESEETLKTWTKEIPKATVANATSVLYVGVVTDDSEAKLPRHVVYNYCGVNSQSETQLAQFALKDEKPIPEFTDTVEAFTRAFYAEKGGLLYITKAPTPIIQDRGTYLYTNQDLQFTNVSKTQIRTLQVAANR